ncbi:MAG: hypothetical protein HYX97_01325, partial [Chloroflexi bacterium]|nr:hypothetical protein [Chloroflexota bacterium]
MIQRTLKMFRVREVFILLALLAVLVLVLTLFRERTLTLIAPVELTSSGILDDLLPPFQDEHNVKVRMEGLSFDQLLKRTRSGEAEIAILDNEVDAADLLDEKIASQASPVFSEQVLLVGPRANPARIAQQDALADSLRNIVAT